VQIELTADSPLLLTMAGDARRSACDNGHVGSSEDADIGRAPICPSCGVTALPAELSNVIDSGFVCENPDCDVFGEPVPS